MMVVSETPYIAWMNAYDQSGAKARMYGPQGNLDTKVIKGHEQSTNGSVISAMFPNITLPQWKNYRDALSQYKADSAQDYNSLGGLGTWGRSITANRWRMIPLTACTSPMSSITPDHISSAEPSRAAMPRSIAVPSTAGITAWELIHTIPKNMPPSCVSFQNPRQAPGKSW